jgi:hypothetical protein
MQRTDNNCIKILCEQHENHSEDQDIDGIIILELILRKQGGRYTLQQTVLDIGWWQAFVNIVMNIQIP